MNLKIALAVFAVFLSGCATRVDNDSDADRSVQPPDFVSVSPESSEWIEETGSKGVKRIFWRELSNSEVNKRLPLEMQTISVLKIDSETSAGFVSAKMSASAGTYQVVMDYAKYTDSVGSNKRMTRVGVGVRIVADVKTAKANIDLGSLFAISAAAKAGLLSGRITVLKIGMDSQKLSVALPTLADISDATLQNSLLAVGAIKARVFEPDTVLTPFIIAERYSGEKLKPVLSGKK